MELITPVLKLSQNFSIPEAVYSETALKLNLNNVPDRLVLHRMEQVAECMERVRALLDNKGIHVNSWYRSPEVNKAVGSNTINSQHIKGEAVDFVCPKFGTPFDICKKIIKYSELIRYDQLILEHNWVHISFAIAPHDNRNQVLSLLATGKYAIGLTDKQGKLL